MNAGTRNLYVHMFYFFAKIFSKKHKKFAKGVSNDTPQPHTTYDKIYMQNVKSGVVYVK